MNGLRRTNNDLTLTYNVEELTPTQIRLLKSIHSLLSHVLTAEEEAEYFDTSAELVKKIAETIKHANFPDQHKQCAYGDQAVEYALDFITEAIEQHKIHNIDN